MSHGMSRLRVGRTHRFGRVRCDDLSRFRGYREYRKPGELDRMEQDGRQLRYHRRKTRRDRAYGMSHGVRRNRLSDGMVAGRRYGERGKDDGRNSDHPRFARRIHPRIGYGGRRGEERRHRKNVGELAKTVDWRVSLGLKRNGDPDVPHGRRCER